MSKLTEEAFAELEDDDKYEYYSDAISERDEIERQFEKLEQVNTDMLAYIHEQHGVVCILTPRERYCRAKVKRRKE